jgi:hypothetical protein
LEAVPAIHPSERWNGRRGSRREIDGLRNGAIRRGGNGGLILADGYGLEGRILRASERVALVCVAAAGSGRQCNGSEHGE